MAHRRCVETGIDTAEQNAQIRRDNVADRLFGRGEKLLPGGFPRLSHDVRSVDVEMRFARGALLSYPIDHRNSQHVAAG